MAVELKVPARQSITEVEIGEWLKNEGDTVAMDETIVMIETDKVTAEVIAPVAGTVQILKSKVKLPRLVISLVTWRRRCGCEARCSAPTAAAPEAPPHRQLHKHRHRRHQLQVRAMLCLRPNEPWQQQVSIQRCNNRPGRSRPQRRHAGSRGNLRPAPTPARQHRHRRPKTCTGSSRWRAPRRRCSDDLRRKSHRVWWKLSKCCSADHFQRNRHVLRDEHRKKQRSIYR